MKKAGVCLGLVLILSLVMALWMVPSSAATVVSQFAITDLDLPSNSMRPDTVVTVPSPLKVHSVEWYDETANTYLESNDYFREGHVYTVVIWVDPGSATFACVNDLTPNVKATVLGLEAGVYKAYEYKAWAMVEVRYTFPAVPRYGWVRTIDVSVTTPEGGKPLSYAKCSRTGYQTSNIFDASNASYNANRKNGIGWRMKGNSFVSLNHADNPVAVPGNIYSVSVDVTLIGGYAFAPNVTYKINGNPASGNLEYGGTVACVSYEFPPTKTVIYRIDLDVPAPKADELPQYPALSGTGFTHSQKESGTTVNGITYLSGNTALSKLGTFAPNTTYTVKVDLKLLEHYALHPQVNVYMNGKPAVITVGSGGEFTLSADFSTGGTQVHNHAVSVWISDGKDHYKVCMEASCHQEIPGTREAHTGGTATCQALAKCTVCGVLYGEKGGHDWSGDWDYSDKTGHAHICNTPGCTVRDSIVPHVEGPTGTPDTAVVCAACGYIIRPAANHVHDLKKIPAREATCMEPGSLEYYACSGCSELFKDAEGKTTFDSPEQIVTAPLGHKPGDWSADGDYHWRTCETCSEALDETKMIHEDGDADGRCDTCAYDKTTGVLPPSAEGDKDDGKTPGGNDSAGTASDGADASDGKKDEKDAESEGSFGWIWIAVAAALLLIALVVVLLVLRKKKRASGQTPPTNPNA